MKRAIAAVFARPPITPVLPDLAFDQICQRKIIWMISYEIATLAMVASA